MNERNVKALAQLIRSATAMVTRTEEAPLVAPTVAEMLASRLAARGVLVPAALTDREATGDPFECEYPSLVDADLVEPAARHRAALERIAKGITQNAQ